MNRGDVWWADLDEPRGSAPGERRPVVIVQDDLLTQTRLGTVMIIPLTSNLKRAEAIGNVLLPAASSGLKKDSVALVCQIITVDKTMLTEKVGALGRRWMQAVDEGLRLALELR